MASTSMEKIEKLRARKDQEAAHLTERMVQSSQTVVKRLALWPTVRRTPVRNILTEHPRIIHDPVKTTRA